MPIDHWLAFAAAAFLLSAIPGPGVATIVGFAFASGRRVALAAVAGLAVGNALAISASLAGAAAVLAASAIAFTLLKLIGAAYLVAIGLLAIARAGRTARTPGDTAPARSRARAAFAATVLVGTLHPKTILFFVAFATQFVAVDRPYLPQALVMVATFTGIAAVTDTAYALVATRAAGLLRGERVRRWTQRLGGGVLVAAGAATAAWRR